MEKIKDYPNYSIDTHGNIWSDNLNSYLKQHVCFYGYKTLTLMKDGIRSKLKVHRILAIQFIPNPENKPCINHKDGDKLNNSLDNLEWCTYQENNKHARETGLNFLTESGKKKHSDRMKKLTGVNHIAAIKVIDVKTKKVYGMITDAAKSIGITTPHLSRMLNGKRPNNTNFIYLND